MTFGEGPLVGQLVNRINQKAADAMVNTALDAGVNLFDTADMYTSGQSETMLGRALKDKRHDVVIATKLGFRSGEALISCGLSRRYIFQALEASLKRLGTDYIDLYQLHIPDAVTPLEETVRALEDVVRRGMARYTAYCNYPAWQAQKLVAIQERLGYGKMASAQMHYSLMGRDIEKEVVPFLEDSGLGLLVWSPLSSGFLTGKYTRENPAPADARRSKFNFPPVDVEKGYEVVAALSKIAEARGTTPATVAIAWLLAKPVVTSVIIGATTMEQLRQNLTAVNVSLSADDVKALDELTAPAPDYPGWMQPMGFDSNVKKALGKS
jgi:aryl-alcohol dehydrogenase-like predicted oxidoreductase